MGDNGRRGGARDARGRARAAPVRRAGAALAVYVLGLAAAGGCGDEPDRLPTACDDSVPAVQEALAKAPGDVALDGGIKLSDCVARARTAAEIQTVGALYTATADALATEMRGRAATASALRLGSLVGAARRGASRTSGLHSELVRRLENSAGLDGAPAARRAAYRRGLGAGRAHG